MSRICFLLILLFTIQSLWAETFVEKSPDGTTRLTIKVDDNITYEIQKDNKVILDHSAIQVIWDNGIDMRKEQLRIKKVKRSERRGSIKAKIRPAARMPYSYNEIYIIFEESYDLVFRIYDQGVAYRFISRLDKKEEQKELIVVSEKSTFNLPGNPLLYYPKVKKFQNSFEENYLPLKKSQLELKTMALTPTLIKSEAGPYMLISEADLRDYPGMYLRPTGTGLEAVFPRYVRKESQEFLGKMGVGMAVVNNMKARKREKYLAQTKTNRNFPWRAILISNDAKSLATNNLIYALAPKPEIKNTSWIKPGKVAWDWYHDWRIPELSFKPGINTETYLYYIDFAAKNNLDYINLDEGWAKNTDLTDINDDIDIERIVAHAKKKDVGVFLWMIWWVLEENMEAHLDQFQKWGIAGIKVDFMDRDDQRVVAFYEKLAKEAAKRKLMINYHGSYKPTGLAMAYPNIINREGVVGLENNKFSKRCTPVHNLTIPFTRNVVGPMDYTPGAMRYSTPEKFKKNWKYPKAMTTRAQQLAMYVVYYGPLQMISDAPTLYPQEVLDFLAKLPTIWDESICLEAAIGENIIMARRNGKDWYIGGMTASKAHKVSVKLDFLSGGEYEAVLLGDGEKLEDLKKVEKVVRKNEELKLTMERNGGFVMVLRKK
ncbi:MAG: glycoside hydrolase family 97 protein [Bacteroidia bacterium]|nr:glycoside hydrolase family 97 protein [Bacteroidia bacterium]